MFYQPHNLHGISSEAYLTPDSSSVQTCVCGGKVGQMIHLASKEVQRLAGPVTVNQSKQQHPFLWDN